MLGSLGIGVRHSLKRARHADLLLTCQSRTQWRRVLQPHAFSTKGSNGDVLDDRRLYKYLKLETFRKPEIHKVFDEIVVEADSANARPSLTQDDKERPQSTDDTVMNHHHVRDFILKRIEQSELELAMGTHPGNSQDERLNNVKLQYAEEEAARFLNAFSSVSESPLNKQTFTTCIKIKSSKVDIKRVMPIAISIAMVGISVGITSPVMPFVVEDLGLSPGQYGHVVSAFALAKMIGNIPSAILVERHGRKPYLVYSLWVVAVGAGGIGLATSFEHLYLCRLFTGFGVAALSTAAYITMSDLSTPRNRASTMAPVMSAFAAGTALGPAVGGMLADSIGISSTFYLVGVSYVGCSLLNHLLLSESKSQPMTFPWQHQLSKNRSGIHQQAKEDWSTTVKDALGQWAPLMSDARVRNVVTMNGFYWFALAGSQMTLLPLMLTDSSGLAMSATGVGKVYMGMSLVQVLGNPSVARIVDRLGKGRAIVGGCTLLSSTMAILPFCSTVTEMSATLGLWALGSTVLSTAPIAYVSDVVNEAKRAQAIALLRTAGDVGFLFGATGAGALADWSGNLDFAMQSSAGMLLTATGWFTVRRHLRKMAELSRESLPK